MTVRILLLALLFLLSSCAGTKALGPKGRTPLLTNQQPVILWVDWAGSGDRLASAEVASEFCSNARRAGVTHLGLETRDWDGRATLGAAGTRGAAEQQLRSAAATNGLRLAAIHPCFVPDAESDEDDLSHVARWTDSGWRIETVAPPRLSPLHRGNQVRDLDLLEEIAKDTSIEIVILSGAGFGSAEADLGPVSRRGFEVAAGIASRQWPEDVIGARPPDFPFGPQGRGPLWATWTAWRANALKRFVLNVHETLLIASSPESPPSLAVVVDAPYPLHQREGLNWVANGSGITQDFPWLPADYGETGVGGFVDAVVLGFWEADLLRRSDAETAGYSWWASMEGASMIARRHSKRDTVTWSAIAVESRSWPGIRTARHINGGLVLLSSSYFLDKPSDWEMLGRAILEQP